MEQGASAVRFLLLNLFSSFVILDNYYRQHEELVQSCKRIVDEQLHQDHSEWNSPGFLSLVCELAVLPQTYEVLAAALTEVAPNDTETTEVNADEEDEFLAYHHSILNWNVGDSQNGNEVE